MKSPILFLIFNRPDTTEKVFETIRQAQPPRLYIAADGPRSNRPAEKELCERTRSIVNNIDWPCEVKTLFRDENLGCGKAVCQAITWFFDNEPEGIIIEDDIVAHPDFFKYCDEMLERYRDDDRVGIIGGHNLLYDKYKGSESYWFSAIGHIWGWASWRRAWKDFDFNFSEKNKLEEFEPSLKVAFKDKKQRRYWREIFNLMKNRRIDIWDYQWTFTLIKKNRLCAVPYVNLTKNIGFGEDSTHTSSASEDELNVVTMPIMPLIHPETVEHNVIAEATECKNSRMYTSLIGRAIKQMKKVIGSFIQHGK